MSAFRSRRLETLLGAQIADADHAQIATLKTSSVPEDSDLEFKGELYGNGDSARRELASDVASFANTVGGLIILGIEEDAQGRADELPGVALSDAEQNRMHQIVASLVAPAPPLDIRQVEDPARPSHGLFLLSVPRSPGAPHAVRINEGYRYPRRTGTTTSYLTEYEIALAYRERFAGLQAQQELSLQYENDLVVELADEGVFAVLTLVPDQPGELPINHANFQVVQRELLTDRMLEIFDGYSWQRVSVAEGCFVADVGHDDKPKHQAARMYRGGAGTFAKSVSTCDESGVERIIDEWLVDTIIGGLDFLVRRARLAAAAGSASLRLSLYPVEGSRPVGLAHFRHHGLKQGFGRPRTVQPVAQAVIDLDSVAASKQELMMAVHALANGIFHAFGVPEVYQIDAEGNVRRKYWSSEVQGRLKRWAEAEGVPIVESTVS
jgi:hypothetical protein